MIKNLIPLVAFSVLLSCVTVSEENLDTTTSTSTSTTSTTLINNTTTIYKDPLKVVDFTELPNALVRLEVKSTKAELSDNFELEIYEYDGTGSGFFISSDGYIVTNNHVVSGAVTIDVYTQYRSIPYSAQLIGLSECDDLAILKIDIADVHYLTLSDSEPILGEEILAAGFPLGDVEVTFLDGIVSKKQTDGSTTWASVEYAFEHTAEILPGSSGGPIVNSQVEVIGIAYAGNEDRQEFGIPIVLVEETINNIINQNFSYSFKANLEQFYGAGLYVYSVDSNSPLRNVGLRGGEIITSIKGLSIIEENTLKTYCDALNTRNPDIGIKFSGISLEDLEEFEVEVSLDGTIANEVSRTSIINIVPAKKPKSTTTTTTLGPVNNTSYFDYSIPDLIKIETFTVSDYLWEIKIYLNDRINKDGSYYGVQNVKHCVISFLAPPYFDSNTNPFTKFGQVKRQQNCTAERLNENEIVITHIVDASSLSFSWEAYGSNEIPISSITLYPAFDIKIEKSYAFSISWSFGEGADCGASERWDSDGKNYSPDCAYQISGDTSWLGNKAPDTHARRISNTNYGGISNDSPYNWLREENYGSQYGGITFSSVQTNNTCSRQYKGYQSKRWWWLDNNLVCIKR